MLAATKKSLRLIMMLMMLFSLSIDAATVGSYRLNCWCVQAVTWRGTAALRTKRLPGWTFLTDSLLIYLDGELEGVSLFFCLFHKIMLLIIIIIIITCSLY